MWCIECFCYILNGPVKVVCTWEFAASTEDSDLLKGCCCFVIHYTDVSKYSVDQNHQGEA